MYPDLEHTRPRRTDSGLLRQTGGARVVTISQLLVAGRTSLIGIPFERRLHSHHLFQSMSRDNQTSAESERWEVSSACRFVGRPS